MTMHADTRKAQARLREGGFTCVLCREEQTHTATARGVAPLLRFLEDGTPTQDFCAADKVVGAGAAYLYVLLGVKEIWAEVISTPALEVLTRYGISAHSEQHVPQIRNRTGDGFCPIEAAVKEATDPEDALARIRRRLAELKK